MLSAAAQQQKPNPPNHAYKFTLILRPDNSVLKYHASVNCPKKCNGRRSYQFQQRLKAPSILGQRNVLANKSKAKKKYNGVATKNERVLYKSCQNAGFAAYLSPRLAVYKANSLISGQLTSKPYNHLSLFHVQDSIPIIYLSY